MTDVVDWGDTVAAFAHAGQRALDIIRSPEVARTWGDASVLAGFTIEESLVISMRCSAHSNVAATRRRLRRR